MLSRMWEFCRASSSILSFTTSCPMKCALTSVPLKIVVHCDIAMPSSLRTLLVIVQALQLGLIHVAQLVFFSCLCMYFSRFYRRFKQRGSTAHWLQPLAPSLVHKESQRRVSFGLHKSSAVRNDCCVFELHFVQCDILFMTNKSFPMVI